VTAVLLLHVAATITMFGIILIVQVVHYPLFTHVGPASYVAYQAEHMTRITWIVLPVMTTELVTAGLLAWWQPLGLPAWMVWTGLGLVGIIWTSTGLVQAPLHSTLMQGFDPDIHRHLVVTNWVRTAAWALRTGLVLWMLYAVLNGKAG
jgi:hypothetical protein